MGNDNSNSTLSFKGNGCYIMGFWKLALFIVTVIWTGIVISSSFGTDCFSPVYSYITIILLYIQFFTSSWGKVRI